MRRTFRLTLDITYEVPDTDDWQTQDELTGDIHSQLLDHGSAAQIRGQLDVDGAQAIIVSPGVEELR